MYIIEQTDWGFSDGPFTEWHTDPPSPTAGCPTDAEGEE
jgi:hypothetical protein